MLFCSRFPELLSYIGLVQHLLEPTLMFYNDLGKSKQHDFMIILWTSSNCGLVICYGSTQSFLLGHVK